MLIVPVLCFLLLGLVLFRVRLAASAKQSRSLETVRLPFGSASVRERAGQLELVFADSPLIQSAVSLRDREHSTLSYTSAIHLAASAANAEASRRASLITTHFPS